MKYDQTASRRITLESVDCVYLLDDDARVVAIDPNGVSALADQPVLGSDWRSLWSDEQRPSIDDAVNVARAGGVGHFVGRYKAGGQDRWWDVSIAAIPSNEAVTRLLAISRDVTGLRTLDLQESRRRDLIEQRLRAIDAASRLFTDSLDFEVTLASIAAVAVDAFATFCVIEVTDGFDRRYAIVRSRRREASAAVERLGESIAREPLMTVAALVVERATPFLRNDISGDWLVSVQTNAETTAALTALDVSAMLCVPIVHDGIATGSISLFVDREDLTIGVGTRFNSIDSLFAEELGRRAGASLANARSYGRERAIAVRMQESALPDILPQIDHLFLSAAYRPSSMEATIAGDWFDAFVLPDGRVALTIGDVGGHGLTAALTMAKLRQAMRAAALAAPTVTSMLNIAEQTLQMDRSDLYATAVAGIFDPADHRLELAGAGHLGPFMRHHDGHIEDLTSFEPLLGVKHVYEKSRSIHVGPGATVVFFTDGLVEFDRDIDSGFERVRTVLQTLPNAGVDLASRLLDGVVGKERTQDDVAILVAYVGASKIPNVACHDLVSEHI